MAKIRTYKDFADEIRAAELPQNTYQSSSNSKSNLSTADRIINGDYQREYERLQQEQQQRQQEQLKKQQEKAAQMAKESMKIQHSEGIYGKGNINLNNRPVVKNSDGTISTVRSMSFNEDGKEILIPTVVNGKIVSDEEAIDHYHKTGEYLGKFDTIEQADEYANQLHLEQEKLYGVDNSGYQPGSVFRAAAEQSANENETIKTGTNLRERIDNNKTMHNPLELTLEDVGNGIQALGNQVTDEGYKAIEDITGIVDNILLGGTRGVKKVGDYAWNVGQANVRNASKRQELVEDTMRKYNKDIPEDYNLADDLFPEDSPIRMLSNEANDFKNKIEGTSKKIDNDIDSKINENIANANGLISKKMHNIDIIIL